MFFVDRARGWQLCHDVVLQTLLVGNAYEMAIDMALEAKSFAVDNAGPSSNPIAV
jgi:hypothetical protein